MGVFTRPTLYLLMFWLLTAAATSVAALAYAVELLFYPLPHVKGIPTVPFWVALLPLVKDIDQMDVFKAYIEEPLRKHGAVKIFFASQWNIIVHHPRYLAEVLKHTSIYEKSGNDEKIPHSVLASLLGNNIISGRGDTWKTYQRVIKPGLQARQDLGRLQDNATKLRNMILDQLEESGSAKLHSIVQKHTINNFTDIFYNTDTKVSLSFIGTLYIHANVVGIWGAFRPDANAIEARNIQASLYEFPCP